MTKPTTQDWEIEFDLQWNLTEGGFHVTPYMDSLVDYEKVKSFISTQIKIALTKQQKINNLVLGDKCDELDKITKRTRQECAEELKNKAPDLVEEYFPKHQCKERGQAIVLIAIIIGEISKWQGKKE